MDIEECWPGPQWSRRSTTGVEAGLFMVQCPSGADRKCTGLIDLGTNEGSMVADTGMDGYHQGLEDVPACD